MKSKYLKAVLGAVLIVLAIFGMLLFLEEYAKSYLRDQVKDEVLNRKDDDDIEYDVPSGDYLSVKGEENTEDESSAEAFLQIVGYSAGDDNETDKLHLIGIISIPSLDIEEPIWKENSSLAMRYGVILMDYSPRPGDKGNSLIVGHRNTITHTIFDRLTKIKNGAAVTITTPEGFEQNYRVNGTYYCSPYDLQDYVGTSEEYPVMVTLITCAREKGNCWRFIVTLIPA